MRDVVRKKGKGKVTKDLGDCGKEFVLYSSEITMACKCSKQWHNEPQYMF